VLTGRILSHYEVLGHLGAGGMGEVYRARDTKLGREVAIKVLPEEVAADPERLARFEGEARVLASMNHPHIAQIYGLEEDHGKRFLVLELVDGETLADRIARGRIPIERALPIALQVARALEAAHERGIVHRDVKPANVMLTTAGDAKVLDFGIARPLGTTTVGQARTRTLDGPPTRPDVAMGTPAYMSPGQLRGERADRRSDIWAFGVTLWEMLTGKRLFERTTDSDTLAAVLQATPDWRQLPSATPPGIQRLLRRCLERDSSGRLHDMADARLEIEDAINEPGPVQARQIVLPTARSAWARGAWPALLTTFALGALFATAIWRFAADRPEVAPPPVRSALTLPEGVTIHAGVYPSLAISPDGRWLVFEAGQGDTRRLFKRSLEQFEAMPIPGTEHGYNPFYSPDGQWLGFFADGKLMKVSLSGGPAQPLADAPNPWGATWGPDGTIVYCPHEGAGLWLVPSAGGPSELLSEVDPGHGLWDVNWPEFLPGGRAVLFAGWRSLTAASSFIGVLDLESGEKTVILENASYARYVSTGHLVFGRAGVVYAVPFDVDGFEVTGPPVPVPEPIVFEWESGVPHLAFSSEGTLGYVAGSGSPRRQLVSVDLEGRETPLFDARQSFMYPRYSPDGERLAVTISARGDTNIWVLDLTTGTQTKLTLEGNNDFPLWTPDGDKVTYLSDRGHGITVDWKRADGIGGSEVLVSAETPGEWVAPKAWSPDGETLVYWRTMPTLANGGVSHIWFAARSGDLPPSPFVDAGARAYGPAISPDGRWLVYVSSESGRPEIYVQPFPDGGVRHQVSTDGGQKPVWSPDGHAIYYRSVEGDRLMQVRVSTSPRFRANAATVLFEGRYTQGAYINQRDYDVAPDGKSFVMVNPDTEWGRATEVRVVLNWFEELERLAPTDPG